MLYVIGFIAAAALGYQLLVLLAAWRHSRSAEPGPRRLPRVSVLKPVHGLEPRFREAIGSHALLDYPDFEILFGVSDPEDPAIPEIERLAADFPHVTLKLVRVAATAPNQKAGVLAALETEASGEVLVVNDSDIVVPRDYLRNIVAPLEDPEVGVVTCPYRAESAHLPGRWEALGIAADFMPGVLVAPLVGVNEFALGSTLAVRAAQLAEAGGFAAIASYLADDYQLGKLFRQRGSRIHVSKTIVRTVLSGRSWRQVWRRQLRWRRTIRVSRPGGYLGLPLTMAAFWAAFAACYGLPWLAVALVTARVAAGLAVGHGVLRCPLTVRWFALIPLLDGWAFAVWVAGLFGWQVDWRGSRLTLDRAGRIIAARQHVPRNGS